MCVVINEKKCCKIIKATSILPMDHSLQMQKFQATDNFSDVESKTIKNKNITIMRLFSIIRSETISVNWGYTLKINFAEHLKYLLPSKEPLQNGQLFRLVFYAREA